MSKGHNSVKYCSIKPQVKLSLDICILNSISVMQPLQGKCKETAQKWKKWNFSKSEGHNSIKIA